MAKSKGEKKDKELTIERANKDLQMAYRAKSKLIAREKSDFLFALGEQWSPEDKAALEKANIKPVVDNRIAPNLFLLTGLERQNRADFKAFPEGEEDGIKAEIASTLFKDAIKKSGFSWKTSEQFKDGITCGESHLELYLDFTDSIINGKPCWQKCDGDALFPDPASREYDFSDARYVYKVKLDVSEGDLINLYPEKAAEIEEAEGGKLDFSTMGGEGDGPHRQKRDYPTRGGSTDSREGLAEETFDLVERYYRKFVKKIFIGDKQTGEIRPMESEEEAQKFIADYRAGIAADQQLYLDALAAHRAGIPQMTGMPPASDLTAGAAAPAPGPLPGAQGVAAPAPLPAAPPPPPDQNPDRFILVKRQVPEIWVYAYIPGMEEPLADERAWFYPKWKSYPFVPYFARFSTAPLTGDERHLLIQGLVHGVKGVQEKHNKAEMLMIRHLNSATNSGWLSEEGSWVDEDAVKNFGTMPGVNLEYKAGKQAPTRITPMLLSQGHAQISTESADAIKAQLGINADLLATQQGGADSGRAIALRQKQGLLMVQELFDNLSRTRQIAGKMLLAVLGECYDTESAKKVLGEAFLRKNFPVVMLNDPNNPETPPAPMKDAMGRPMEYDKEMAQVAIEEVLSGDLGNYNVSVGEAVASETQKMSVAAEIKEIAAANPGLVPPDIMIRHSQLPESAKTEILSAFAKAQEAAAAQAANPQPAPEPRKK